MASFDWTLVIWLLWEIETEVGLVLSLDGMVVAAVSILIAKGLSSGLLELKEKKYINLSLNS